MGLLQRVTHLGVDLSRPRHEYKHVVLTNQYALFLALVTLAASVGPMAHTLLPEVRFWLAISVPALAAVLALNALRLHALATLWLLAAFLVSSAAIARLEPVQTQHIGFFILNASVAWFLFPPGRWLWRLAIVIPSALCAVALPLWLSSHPPPLQLPGFDVDGIAFGNTAIFLLALSFFAHRATSEVSRAEHELLLERERNEQLLKREVAHQVAERSRQLGAAAARATAELVAPPLSGQLGRYEVVKALGQGGMAAVYEVTRKTDGRRLALKLLKGVVSPELAARLAREAEIGARLHSSNLVEIVDVGATETGVPYLVMELVGGGSLETQRARFGDVGWALPILRDVARGLEVLHAAGVVHRDLKPANVLLTEAGEAKLSDFGIARLGVLDGAATLVPGSAGGLLFGSPLTRTDAWVGTPLYMAPEAANGAVGTPADVFAFGILAYELLTGRPPFANPAVLLAMAGQPLPAPPALNVSSAPDGVGALIIECLSADPTLRPSAPRASQVLAATADRT